MPEPLAPSEALLTKLRRLVDYKRDAKIAKEAEKKAAARLATEQEACYDELEATFGQKPSFTFDLGEGYGRVQFTAQEQVYARVFNKDAAAEALDEEGLAAELLKRDFNMTGLNQLVQARTRNRQDMPAGVGQRFKRWITVTSR